MEQAREQEMCGNEDAATLSPTAIASPSTDAANDESGSEGETHVTQHMQKQEAPQTIADGIKEETQAAAKFLLAQNACTSRTDYAE
jgi:hypothetical protein